MKRLRAEDLSHFYHVWCEGQWRDPVAEHMAALEDSGFDGEFVVGLVGGPVSRADALLEIGSLRHIDRVIHADGGWEQETLREVRLHADEHGGAVLYAHTKGAANANEFQSEWRRSMTYHVLTNWRANVDSLASGYDLVGCHWLTREEFPGIVADTPLPMIGGNFWMATCQYLRTLPPLLHETRHDAEAWVGLGDPNVLDLFPGWPGTQPFYRPRIRRLIAGR